MMTMLEFAECALQEYDGVRSSFLAMLWNDYKREHGCTSNRSVNSRHCFGSNVAASKSLKKLVALGKAYYNDSSDTYYIDYWKQNPTPADPESKKD